MTPAAGDRFDRFTLIDLLGSGGQGVVWRATDPLDGGRTVAVKLARLDRAPADIIERARRERDALDRAPHPALLVCHGLFVDRDHVGMAVELVEGKTLSDADDDVRASPAHRDALVLHIARALAHVHAHGLVHRDLKPDNVLVANRFWPAPHEPGTVKLIDFGIAVQIGNPRPMTSVGHLIGTLPYLAPEVLAAPGTGSDFQRDMFAFGVLTYELFVGRHPTGLPTDAPRETFTRAYTDAARRTLPWPPRDIPGPIGAALEACLALRPEARPASGTALMRLLSPDGGASATVSGQRSARSEPARVLTERTPVPTSAAPPLSPLPATAPFPGPPSRAVPTIPDAPEELGLAPATWWGAGRVWSIVAERLWRSRSRTTQLGLAALAATSFIITMSVGWRGCASEPESAAERPAIALTWVSLSPPPTVTPGPRADICDVKTCCGGIRCLPREGNQKGCGTGTRACAPCASGRSCVPESCDDDLAKNRRFKLRTARVVRGYRDLETATVCVKILSADSAEECQRVNTGAQFESVMTTADILQPGTGLSIEVRDGSRVIGRRLGTIRGTSLQASALCKGVFFGGGFGTAIDSVTFFLDDAP